MGITNDLFRNEVAPGIDPETLKLCDLIPDPEDRRDPLTGLARHGRLRGVHEIPSSHRTSHIR